MFGQRTYTAVVCWSAAVVGCWSLDTAVENTDSETCLLQVHSEARVLSQRESFVGPPANSSEECKKVEVQPNFNLTEYVSTMWYIQQQMPVAYLSVEDNYCVTAQYSVRSRPSIPWRYEITVNNKARTGAVDGTPKNGALCAYVPDKSEPAKLAVAPCFLPRRLAGPYWVLAFDNDEGYALVSGGQPTIWTPQGCQTGTGINNAGLWIFTRAPNPAPELVSKVRGIAADQGFDLSVLNNVTQEGCTGNGYD